MSFAKSFLKYKGHEVEDGVSSRKESWAGEEMFFL